MFDINRGWFVLRVGFLFSIALIGLWLILTGASQYPTNPSLVDKGTPRQLMDRPGGFRDVAAESGIRFRMRFLPDEQGEKFKVNLYDHGCGVAVGDYDGDGYEDIYFVNQLGPNALYRNKGDGTFVDVTREAGVGLGDRICVGATFADFDNDGRPDLFVTSTRGGNVLFKNLGNGKFEDVTKEAGLTLVAHCQTAAFFDYDNDGYLDLFVTCTAKWTTDDYNKKSRYYPGLTYIWDLLASPKERNILYRNNGNGTFTNVTAEAGLAGLGWGGDTAVFDFDGDGHLDLLVTNMFGNSQLYRNNGDRTFTDVTPQALGRTSFGAIGCKAFDYDNDGKLDLLIVDMHSDMWLQPQLVWDKGLIDHIKENEGTRYATFTGPFQRFNKQAAEDTEKKHADTFKLYKDKLIFGNTMFKNLGDGKFSEVAVQAGLETFWPWGIATGDFNNDGFEDVFLPSGMGYPFFYWPNRLMMNEGNGTFAERSREEEIEPPARGMLLPEMIGGMDAARSSRCAAVADFRNCGRLDIITNNFNDSPYLFQNQFPKKHFIAFRLQGTKSNRDAIGAVVRIYLGPEVMVRQVHAAGGYLSHSSRTAHFGLGDRTRVDRVYIQWPSGIRQQIIRPEIDRLHFIVEAS